MNPLPLAVEIVVAVLLVVGSAFALISAVALVKFDDFLKRLHGPSKVGTVGVGGVLLAALIYFAATGATSLHEILIVALVFLTAPVSAHLLVKAAQKLDPSLRRAPPPPGNDRKPQ
ncbi:MAG: monovalent cation/H(+) antiporter subunit G [Burkholderiales bacterium]|jgi:multicomponent K+:H+ antiporter subunit G|nr:monovalent cation/H(+) antiporter subunit G [Burkholderiales bacterium]